MAKLNLSSIQTSKLALTPQLQNAIKLLQYSAIELNQEIQNIFESNPLIEKDDICEDFEEDDCQIHYSHYEDFSVNQNKNLISTSEIIEKTTSDESSLQDYLLWQVQLLNISDKDKKIAESIVDYINEDGYLIKEIFEIFDDIFLNSDITLDEIIAVQHLLQNLDPVGTCTQNIQESLVIQLQNYESHKDIVPTAIIIVTEFFEDYTNNNRNSIISNLNLNEDKYNLIDNIIKNQSARPGSKFSSKKDFEYIMPDVKIFKKNSEWIIQSNKLISPNIRINEKYVEYSNEKISSEDRDYLKSNLQEAKLFIKNIKYRNDTLMKLSKCILRKQLNFFENGKEDLIPLNLKEIAQDIEVHESTVSRLTSGKYMETPYGVFELKYFFSSSVTNKTGKKISSQSIKEKIKKIIKSENKSKPFSDQKISQILKDDNINVARRTVTKYRESLNFESSSERKTK